MTSSPYQAAARSAALVSQLPVVIGLGAGLGGWADAQRDSSPTLLVVGVFVGVLVGSLTFLRGFPSTRSSTASDDEPPANPS